MMKRILVPMRVPSWLHGPLLRAKRSLVPPAPVAKNIEGERHVEWTFLSSQMPSGPGEAIEFGCEEGYMSLLAARRGFHVVANDLQEQSFLWQHPHVEFRQGDFLKLELPRNHFDLAINCSSVEHVGVTGRYGITIGEDDGDIRVMNRLAEVLRPNGRLLMTAPCGRDMVLAPWCRVYGAQRLPRLFECFRIEKEEFWMKNEANQWVSSDRGTVLNYQPHNNPSDPYGCSYALGCFVLQKL